MHANPPPIPAVPAPPEINPLHAAHDDRDASLDADDASAALAVPKITRSVLAAADGDDHPRRKR